MTEHSVLNTLKPFVFLCSDRFFCDSNSSTFATYLGHPSMQTLLDHIVHGKCIMPFTGLLEIVAAALKCTDPYNTNFAINAGAIPLALQISKDNIQTVETKLSYSGMISLSSMSGQSKLEHFSAHSVRSINATTTLSKTSQTQTRETMQATLMNDSQRDPYQYSIDPHMFDCSCNLGNVCSLWRKLQSLLVSQ